MKRLLGRLAVGAVALAAFGASGGLAQAQTPPSGISIVDGTTAPVFDYQQATRERVYIPNGLDQDNDGVEDRTVIEIIRPKESGPSLKVPAIIDPSPYYTTLCRGNESECIGDVDGDGINDKWPLFYDNYFVPRGYAYILAEADGTANSTGCPLHGGPGDVQSMVKVIDWLQGRTPGFSSMTGGSQVFATWHNGKAAMFGKSYDGTFTNGVASTGVDGLTTIMPISAISAWYDYSRFGGIRQNTHYPASLSNTVTNSNRRALCAPTRDAMSLVDGDATGDINDFWQARNYVKDVAKVKASVFISHGLQDDNVRPNQFSQWWLGLAANNVPRKLWLSREGHVDPFDYRRGAWVDTVHRWLDHWLYGIENGIMDEPRVDVEETKDVWKTYGDWPVPGSQDVGVYLQGDTQSTAGTLGGASGGGKTDTLQWTDLSNQGEDAAIDIAAGTTQSNRRVFLSSPLQTDVHVSGVPTIDIRASLDKPQSNLGAILVDYGNVDTVHVTHRGDGVTTPSDAPEDCVGESSTRVGPDGKPADFDACYKQITKVTTTVTPTQGWRVSRGVLDSSNRDSLFTGTLATPGTMYEFRYPILPVDYVFPAGHRIGIVLVANYSGFVTNGTTGTTITLDSRLSKVDLPVVGGYGALSLAGALQPVSTQGSVGGDVPATLSLTMGSKPSFGDFTPGLAKTYTSSTTATVISTAGDALLTVSDPDTVHPGHLVNGTFALAQGLQVKATDPSNSGSPFNQINGSYNLLAWSAPVSNDPVTISFQQQIGANEALRTGSYDKTLTYTLSTTTP